MADFETEIQAWIDQVNGLVDLSISDKEQIAKAGGEIFRDDLKSTTKNRHYRMRKTGANPHLSSGIRMKMGNRDGKRYGAVTVGWDNRKAHIANFIENGTRVAMVKTSKTGKKYRLQKGGQVGVRKDPFVSEVQTSESTNAKMLEKMNDKYIELTKGK